MLRRGEVDVAWTPNNANQCGYRRVHPELSKLWYEAYVVGDSDHLDAQGFIADQFEIHQTIVDCLGHPDIFKSCEQSCELAANALWARFGPAAQVQRICQIKLTIGAIGPDGDKWAGITAELGDLNFWRTSHVTANDGRTDGRNDEGRDSTDPLAPLTVSSYDEAEVNQNLYRGL
jgi:hypothetical protein